MTPEWRERVARYLEDAARFGGIEQIAPDSAAAFLEAAGNVRGYETALAERESYGEATGLREGLRSADVAQRIGAAAILLGYTTPDFLRDDARELRDRAFDDVAELLEAMADALKAAS